MPPLLLVVLAQGYFDIAQPLDMGARFVVGAFPEISRITSSTYSSFRSARHPSYRLLQRAPGAIHTAKVSAKSSAGCACAYQPGR